MYSFPNLNEVTILKVHYYLRLALSLFLPAKSNIIAFVGFPHLSKNVVFEKLKFEENRVQYVSFLQ